VFGYDDGSHIGETWWRKRFCAAMKRAGIDWQARHLSPHSFRHTINTIVRNSGQDPAKIRARHNLQHLLPLDCRAPIDYKSSILGCTTRPGPVHGNGAVLCKLPLAAS